MKTVTLPTIRDEGANLQTTVKKIMLEIIVMFEG